MGSWLFLGSEFCVLTSLFPLTPDPSPRNHSVSSSEIRAGRGEQEGAPESPSPRSGVQFGPRRLFGERGQG